MDKNVLYITEKGGEKIRNRISSLETRLSYIRKRKGEASESGGNAWHDNAEFEDLEHQERMLIGEIQNLKSKLSMASVVNSKRDRAIVSIGSIVNLKYLDTGETIQIEIVGHGEGDPQEGLVSYDSPLGLSILGSKAGEERRVEFNNNTCTIKILTIN